MQQGPACLRRSDLLHFLLQVPRPFRMGLSIRYCVPITLCVLRVSKQPSTPCIMIFQREAPQCAC